MYQQDEPETSKPFQLVENPLGEPLLICPAVPVRPDGQRVVSRESVLGDYATGQERHPAVDRHRDREVRDQRERERNDDDHYRSLPLQERPEAGSDAAGMPDAGFFPDAFLAHVHPHIMQAITPDVGACRKARLGAPIGRNSTRLTERVGRAGRSVAVVSVT